MKKAISVILALIMVFSVVAVIAYAEDPVDYNCSYCNNTFRGTSADRKAHEDKCNDNPSNWKCTFCGLACPSYDARAEHEDKCVKNPNNEKKEYTCPTCQAVFDKASDLNEHIKAGHKGDTVYPCPECPMQFDSLEAYNNHIKEHEPLGTATHTTIFHWDHFVGATIPTLIQQAFDMFMSAGTTFGGGYNTAAQNGFATFINAFVGWLINLFGWASAAPAA